MAANYQGSTAASSVANPPVRMTQGPMGGYMNLGSTSTPVGGQLWLYASTDDSTAMFTANYFSDGYYLGMKQGDVVMKVGMTSTVASSQVLTFGVIGAVSTAGTQCSTFSLISST